MAKSEYTIDPDEHEDCATCGGAEQLECPTCDGIGMTVNSRQREVVCKECDGEGWVDCPDCQ